jgi:hypothetical protein
LHEHIEEGIGDCGEEGVKERATDTIEARGIGLRG